MSENLEDNEPRIIPPAVGNTQNEHVEPLIGTEHAPRVARSVSSDPEESALPSSGAATPVRPAPRRSAPRARRMSLSLTRLVRGQGDVHAVHRRGDYSGRCLRDRMGAA